MGYPLNDPNKSIPESPSPDLHAALSWLSAIGAENGIDLEKLSSLLVDDYEQHVLPLSLKREPKKSKKEFMEYFTQVSKMFGKNQFKITIFEIVDAPGRAVFHARSESTTITGSPYGNEYSLIFHLEPGKDGGESKVKKCMEFVDSHYSVSFFPAEREKLAKLQAGSS